MAQHLHDALSSLLGSLHLQSRDVDSKASIWILVAAAVGIASLSSYVTSFGKMVLDLARSGTSLNKYGAKKGHWAIVTGCTSGIGREFAVQLSKAGFRVLLVARNEGALKALQNELRTESDICVVDFSRASSSDYSALSDKVSQCKNRAPVGVLVNNVGVGHTMPVDFWECDDGEMDGILEINCRATMKVTKIALNQGGMVQARNGLILNIGSFAAMTSSPMLAPYAGSKAFLYTWSQALGSELEKHRIKVSLVNTYFVVSNLSKIRRSNFMTPTPKVFVRSALSHIGLPCGATTAPYISTPFYSHALVQWVVDHLFTKKFWISYTRRMHVDIRRRALAKAERAKRSE